MAIDFNNLATFAKVTNWMIKIVERLLDPIRLFTKNGIVPGDIITIHNGIYCKLSNSCNPFGMVVGYPDQFKLILIMCDMAIIKTDNYDVSKIYNIGDSLYSSERGQLTNEKYDENSLLLGHVLRPTSKENSLMEISWI